LRHCWRGPASATTRFRAGSAATPAHSKARRRKSSPAALAAHPGVSGLDLLAYRSTLDAGALIRAVCAAVDKPVIVAGSIEGPDQIDAVRTGAAAGFTIGTAALDGRFPAPGRDLPSQLAAISAACSRALH
jgi:hypothetical protein